MRDKTLECSGCGEYSLKLLNGECALCRRLRLEPYCDSCGQRSTDLVFFDGQEDAICADCAAFLSKPAEPLTFGRLGFVLATLMFILVLHVASAHARAERFPALLWGPNFKWASLCFDYRRDRCVVKLSIQEVRWLKQEAENAERYYDTLGPSTGSTAPRG